MLFCFILSSFLLGIRSGLIHKRKKCFVCVWGGGMGLLGFEPRTPWFLSKPGFGMLVLGFICASAMCSLLQQLSVYWKAKLVFFVVPV